MSVGGASGGCINPTPQTTNYVVDPMSYVTAPSWSGCDHPNQVKANNNQTVNLAPGVYCNKITAQNGGTINFAAGLYVLDGIPDPARLDASLDYAIAVVPRLRQRVVEVPLRLGLPQWIDDPHFDRRYHLRHVSLPHPGDERHLLT